MTRHLLRPLGTHRSLSVWPLGVALALQEGASRGLRRASLRVGRRDRGDVPGWVLITVMTVALVGLIWAIAKDQIVAIFQNSLNKAKGI